MSLRCQTGRRIGIKPTTKSISPFCVELLVSTFMATKSSEIGLTLLKLLLLIEIIQL